MIPIPEGWKLDRLQNTTKLAGMTCHLINKAAMRQKCTEVLNQHAQPLKKKAALSSFTWNFGNPSTKTTEKRADEQLIGPIIIIIITITNRYLHAMRAKNEQRQAHARNTGLTYNKDNKNDNTCLTISVPGQPR